MLISGSGSRILTQAPPPPPPPPPAAPELTKQVGSQTGNQAAGPAIDTAQSGSKLLRSMAATIPPLPCGNGCVTPPLPPSDAKPGDAPKAVSTGAKDYYLQRAADFEARNPGMKAPDYYTDYGNKYAERFSSLDSTDLSPAGLKWRDQTLVNLKEMMEGKRAADPEGFAALERNPEAFRQMAYETHVQAYLDAGLADLPVQDLMVIGATPDFNDVASGLPQMQQVVAELIKPEHVVDIAKATVIQSARDLGPVPIIPIIAGPGPVLGTVVGREAERVVDRLADHCGSLLNKVFG